MEGGIASVKADYFVKSGDFSFSVSSMRHVGLGDQLEKLEKLRAKLRAGDWCGWLLSQ